MLDVLRKHLNRHHDPLSVIAEKAEIDFPTLKRFKLGSNTILFAEEIDRLCKFLKLELVPCVSTPST